MPEASVCRSQPISWCRPCSIASAPLRSANAGSQAAASVSSSGSRILDHGGHAVADRRSCRRATQRCKGQHRGRSTSGDGPAMRPSTAVEPTSASIASPKCIVSELRIAASSSPSSPALVTLRVNGHGGHRLHRAGKAQILAEAQHRLHAGIGIRAQNPRAPAIRGCRAAYPPLRRRSARRSRRRFLPGRSPSAGPSVWACAPEPSETTTSGPSSSQRSSGRLAAERSVQAQSSFCALRGARLRPAATASLRRGCSA